MLKTLQKQCKSRGRNEAREPRPADTWLARAGTAGASLVVRTLCPSSRAGGWLGATEPCGLSCFPPGVMDLHGSSHSLPPSPPCDQRHVFVRELDVARSETGDRGTQNTETRSAQPLASSATRSYRRSLQTLSPVALEKGTHWGPPYRDRYIQKGSWLQDRD